MLDLVDTAKAIGFDAFGASGQYEDLMQEKMPCIVHVIVDNVLQHFVVVYKIGKKGVLAGDPGKGLYKMSKNEFCGIWKSKACVLLSPGENLLSEPAITWLKWIFEYLKKDKVYLSQATFLGAVYTVIGLINSIFIQKLIDKYIPEKNFTWIYLSGIFLLILLLIRASGGFIRDKFLVMLNKRISLNITGDFFEHLFRLPKKFFDTRKRGDITARIHDTIRIQQAVLQIAGLTAVDILVILGSFSMLFYFSLNMASIAAVVFPVYGGILFLSTKKLKLQQNDVMKNYAQVESVYIDTLGGHDEINSYNTDKAYTDYNKIFFSFFQESIEKLGYTQAKLNYGAELISALIIIGMLFCGSYWVVNGNLRLGEMIAAYTLAAGILSPINRLVGANISLQSANIAAMRIMDMLLIKKEENLGSKNFEMFNGIAVRDAAFSWDTRKYLFENISMNIPVGRITALWGPSGAGKSTFVQLLQRKYELNRGVISIDGIDCRNIELSDYRKNIGVLPQQIKIFNGTLAENITAGREIKSLEGLNKLIEKTGLSSFVKRFENGLFTVLGENGRKFSGGEIQMLALIRALLFNPGALIIDEGLSGIDYEIEEKIYNKIKEYSRDHAVLLITHNLASLLKADYIYLLRDRSIYEQGNPKVLIKNGNVFGNSIKTQYSHLFENESLIYG